MHGAPPSAFFVAALGCTLALAACGSGGKPTTAASSNGYASFLKFSECMRGHGVANFPDPTFGKGGGVQRFAPSSLKVKSPAFQSALKACGGGQVQVPDGAG